MNVHFEPIRAATDMSALRADVRAFLDEKVAHLPAEVRAQSWSGWDDGLSAAMGARGWIGMTWPTTFGGQAASQLDRYTVVEEMLAAGAPVAAHWIADRQSGALILKFGSDDLKRELVPQIATGKLFFCIGMSEPNSGSDLASLRTRAQRVDGGWSISGSKIWTTFADKSQFMIALVRTTQQDARSSRDGLSQLVVDLSSEGVTIRPIEDQTGAAHFCEVFFDSVFVPDRMLLGEEGQGWAQVTAELALERSGPERFLSSHVLLEAVCETLNEQPDDAMLALLGEWAAELWVLRQMSLSVASRLERGEAPMLEAAIVKDLGARYEQSIARDLSGAFTASSFSDAGSAIEPVLTYLVANSPCFSLRGGTREILRGIIARELGLR